VMMITVCRSAGFHGEESALDESDFLGWRK